MSKEYGIKDFLPKTLGKCDICEEEATSRMGGGGLYFRACREHEENSIWKSRWGSSFKNLKSYRCPVCWKHYKTNGNTLKKHIESHSEEEVEKAHEWGWIDVEATKYL